PVKAERCAGVSVEVAAVTVLADRIDHAIAAAREAVAGKNAGGVGGLTCDVRGGACGQRNVVGTVRGSFCLGIRPLVGKFGRAGAVVGSTAFGDRFGLELFATRVICSGDLVLARLALV